MTTTVEAVRRWTGELSRDVFAGLSVFDDGTISISIGSHGVSIGLVLDAKDADELAHAILGDRPEKAT